MPKLLGFICGAAAGAVVGLVLAASVLAVWDRAARSTRGWASWDVWG